MYTIGITHSKNMPMLTLYYKPTCPYCQHVLGEAEDMGVQFRLKDVDSDPSLYEELIEQGGKHQVPFLIDSERGVKLYESENIIAYLKEHYAGREKDSFGGLKIHASDEICESCQ